MNWRSATPAPRARKISRAVQITITCLLLLGALLILDLHSLHHSKAAGLIRQRQMRDKQPLDQDQLEHDVQTFDFIDTPYETQCFNGGPPAAEPPEPMPKLVHFTWALKPDGAELDFLGYLAIRAALVSLTPDVTKLHHTYLNQDNQYWQKLKDNVTLVYHAPNTKEIHVAHKSDVMRLNLLRTEGGIYLDMDAYALKPFDTLLRSTRDLVLGHEGGNRWGLCNAIMLARKNSTFVERWIDRYSSFDSSQWNYHSVILPKEMSAEYLDEICTLSPTVFFWPTWTYAHITYMHEELSDAEAAQVQEQLDEYGGVLYENQLAYHAWNQMAYERYTRFLTPNIMQSRNTRFNMLMRRFLD